MTKIGLIRIAVVSTGTAPADVCTCTNLARFDSRRRFKYRTEVTTFVNSFKMVSLIIIRHLTVEFGRHLNVNSHVY
jgi:hypothetical protein